jgi:hypothetical protein
MRNAEHFDQSAIMEQEDLPKKEIRQKLVVWMCFVRHHYRSRPELELHKAVRTYFLNNGGPNAVLLLKAIWIRICVYDFPVSNTTFWLGGCGH